VLVAFAPIPKLARRGDGPSECEGCAASSNRGRGTLRTTHMTGRQQIWAPRSEIFFSRLFRRGLHLKNYRNQGWIDRDKFALRSCLLASFIAGGICDSAAYTTLQLHTLLLPAGLAIVLRLLHMAYGISNRSP